MTYKDLNTTSSDARVTLEIARATAQSLFLHAWDGSIRYASTEDDYDDACDDAYIDQMDGAITQEVVPRSWEEPAPALALSLSEDEIAAAIEAGCDPWACSRDHRGRALRAEDPPPSLIVASFGISRIVEDHAQLEELFASGSVTRFTCGSQPFFDIFPQLMRPILDYWRDRLPREPKVRLDYLHLETREARRRNAINKGARVDAKIGSSLARGFAVLLATEQHVDLPDAVNALVARTPTWSGVTAADVMEALRLTHSWTGQMAEAELLRRLPDPETLQEFTPEQIDAAFTAPTTLQVVDRMCRIAERFSRPIPKITLEHLHGIDEACTTLKRMLNDMRLWKRGSLDWGDVASSAILYGPPGTGKTTLAKAFAGSAGIPLIQTSYSECQKGAHQGEMLAALDQAFVTARQSAPAVLFIDELDSFSARGSSSQSKEYLRGVVNGLLEQINNAADVSGLILLGATNHLTAVDPAVTRSGRFDLKVHIPYPGKAGLEAILRAKLEGRVAADVRLAPVVARLVGCSGADVEAVARDAMGRARLAERMVTAEDLEDAADQLVPRQSDAFLRRVAIHEAGHVMMIVHLGLALPSRVSLTAQGGQVDHVSTPTLTSEQTLERLQILLAGRAAEISVLGAASSGAGGGEQSDLARATGLALAMERQWGLGESGLSWENMSAADLWRAPPELRDRVEAHLSKAEAAALECIEARKPTVLALADQLLEERELHTPDIAHVLRRCEGRNRAMSAS